MPFTAPPLAEHLPADAYAAAEGTDGMPTIVVPPERLVDVATRLREALAFVVCVDVTAADHFGRDPRFDVVYHLVAPDRGWRLRMKVQPGAADPRVPTVSGVWPSANWQEREVYDLFGIRFDGHPDLTRLLMPDDWDGHPLRKDYPVQVKVPVKTYEPVQLTAEEFRANVEADRKRRS